MTDCFFSSRRKRSDEDSVKAFFWTTGCTAVRFDFFHFSFLSTLFICTRSQSLSPIRYLFPCLSLDSFPFLTLSPSPATSFPSLSLFVFISFSLFQSFLFLPLFAAAAAAAAVFLFLCRCRCHVVLETDGGLTELRDSAAPQFCLSKVRAQKSLSVAPVVAGMALYGIRDYCDEFLSVKYSLTPLFFFSWQSVNCCYCPWLRVVRDFLLAVILKGFWNVFKFCKGLPHPCLYEPLDSTSKNIPL